ncbi:PHD finger protein 20-like protein 1 isoform X3 [Conger conger]|uniref:PHD finger protein 20-like protein 1 isoform X3 n=1 Tax=Conger conger TaxID=82655 RepID=UPI002A5A574A|nr:PHD finger protein 20-like protein 1 isoform X3 [Conger conger]
MSKKPPNRPGLTFEIGARVEAQDYLQKWYPSRIEKIDYDEGKMLVHFDRWSHRYDEWIFWDSSRLRPLERPAFRKEGLKDEEEMSERLGEMRTSRYREPPGCMESREDQTELPQSRQVLKDGEEVLARWTDCRYYPAKIETVNKEGTYTVQFYDGVIRCVKRMHIKSMPEDAKGQDWIALVKAATAAAKSKGACRPRTSANSNKDKEARREEEEDSESEEDTDSEDMEEDLDSEKSVTLESAVEEEAKSSAEQLESGKMKRRKAKQGSLFNTKRARLCKNPGLLVSKVVSEDEGVHQEEQADLPGTSEEGPESAAEEPGTPEDCILTLSSQRQAPVMAGSQGRPGNRRFRLEPGENHGTHKPPRLGCSVSPGGGASVLPAPIQVPSPPSITQTVSAGLPVTAAPISPRASEQSQRRRRSQRLAPSTPEPLLEPGNPSPPPSQDEIAQSSQGPSEALPIGILEKSVELPPSEVPPETSLPPPQPPITVKDEQTDTTLSNQVVPGMKSSPPAIAAGPKVTARTPKPNKHTREPIINVRRSDDPTSPNEPLFDLDHNKFKCQVPGCSKAFRKAKLLDYHLKYYHSADKEVESEAWSPDRAGRTRTTSATVPTSTPDNKRRRTVSTSSSLSPPTHIMPLECSGGCPRPPKLGKKKRSSVSVSSDSSEVPLALLSRERNFENLHDKILKKVIDKDPHMEPGLIKTEKKIKLEDKCQPVGKKKEKDKERKDKKIKLKKKKKKKKKSKQHSYSDFEDISLAFLERCSSSSPFPLHSSVSSKPSTFQYPRAILSVDLTGENLSDIDFLEDSTTESLLLSGEEYGQDLDSLTMDDFQEEDEEANEIVRCICEMDEENGFMIQCEECMCWQHSVCMGLLEDSIPDQYICYICRDPPRQRWSAKYRHEKDWLNKGHLYGLSFLSENYSHQNAKKMVSTHQLLADVYSVKKVLHGLQLKMEILQNKHDPDLHLWARSWVNSEEDQPMGGVPDCVHYQEHLDSLSQSSTLDAYIASEHSYQKPAGLGLGSWPIADPLSLEGEEGVRLEEGPEVVAETSPHTPPFELKEEEQGSAAISMSGCLNETRPDSAKQARNCLQWQLNLLTHIEDIQNQVANRMDLIEKELDVLESWLDFTGELEPPEPLARLPQLKRRIKQLLTDLGKVQQMSSLCSV